MYAPEKSTQLCSSSYNGHFRKGRLLSMAIDSVHRTLDSEEDTRHLTLDSEEDTRNLTLVREEDRIVSQSGRIDEVRCCMHWKFQFTWKKNFTISSFHELQCRQTNISYPLVIKLEQNAVERSASWSWSTTHFWYPWTILFSKKCHMLGLSGTLSFAVFVYLRISVFVYVYFVFSSLTHGNKIFDILEQSNFQKYATCWVFLALSHMLYLCICVFCICLCLCICITIW